MIVPQRLVSFLARTLHSTSQLPVRMSMLILGIMVGLDLLLGAAHAESLVRLPLFLLLLFVVRGLPVLLYCGVGIRDRLGLALFSATSLPLVVVIASIGRATGRMLPENAAALIGAAILSVLIFPLVALLLRDRETGGVAEAPDAA